MKKVSIISLILIFVCAGMFLTNRKANAQTVNGWFLAGDKPKSYTIGLDKSIFKSGNSSAFLKSTDKKIDGFGTLMQTCNAKDFLGKRVKMTAYVKSENVMRWAGMWLRVDSKAAQKAVSFDNMQDRPIKGTSDWIKCEIILDVPEESGTLNYGILLSGTGKVWFDDLTFEIVDKLKVNPTKANLPLILDKPVNTSFD